MDRRAPTRCNIPSRLNNYVRPKWVVWMNLLFLKRIASLLLSRFVYFLSFDRIFQTCNCWLSWLEKLYELQPRDGDVTFKKCICRLINMMRRLNIINEDSPYFYYFGTSNETEKLCLLWKFSYYSNKLDVGTGNPNRMSRSGISQINLFNNIYTGHRRTFRSLHQNCRP